MATAIVSHHVCSAVSPAVEPARSHASVYNIVTEHILADSRGKGSSRVGHLVVEGERHAKIKKALFAGLFEETKDEISFEKLGRKSMMRVIKEVFSDQLGRPKPVINSEPPKPVMVTEVKAEASKDDAKRRKGTASDLPMGWSTSQEQRTIEDGAAQRSSPDASQAIGKFLDAGLALLESLSTPRSAGVSEGSKHSAQIERILSAIFQTDEQNHRPTLVIPLPASVSLERLATVIGGFFEKLAGPQ